MNQHHQANTCYHCALPLPADKPLFVRVDGVERAVCCPACLAVVQTIVGGGLGNYYRFRDETERAGDSRRPAPAANADAFSEFDQVEFQQRWLVAREDGDVEAELLIGGMHCAACVWLLENYLRRQPGVNAVHVHLGEQRVHVRWSPRLQRLSSICNTIAALGYEPEPCGGGREDHLRRREHKRALRALGIAGIGMMQVGMCALALYAGAGDNMEIVYRDLLRWISLILSIPIVFYSGQSFFAGAWRGLRRGAIGMDVPIALAIALAFAASLWATLRGDGEVYFDSITMFIFLLLGSRYLEMRARHYNGSLGADLLSLLPGFAIRLEGGRQQHVPPDQLRVGDTVLVGGGQTIPADGTLLDASASINEAAISGEFKPVAKQRGDTLLAGSINGAQALTLQVSGVGPDLRLAAIHALGRYARGQKPRLAQLADRIAGRFALAILLAAALTGLGWLWMDPARAFWIALSVLVVSCPCALCLATPLAIASGTAALRARGLLVIRGDAWEQLPHITDVIFDKTGTLTAGHLRVVATHSRGGRSPAVCRELAAALEAGLSHPIARAFADERVTPAQARVEITGRGIEGSIAGRRYRLGHPDFALELCRASGIKTPGPGQWLLLADNKAPLCWFQLDDQMRHDAPATVRALHRAGLRTHLLSGDRSDAVPRLARTLGMTRFEGGATPERKLDYVTALQHAGARVLMIGDGINDIPVLAGADVSVAMSNASQLAKTDADCILLAPRLERLPELISAARATSRTVRVNLAWALFYNALALPLAAGGWVPPWLAALGMSLSSLLVVGNSLWLRRRLAQASGSSQPNDPPG